MPSAMMTSTSTWISKTLGEEEEDRLSNLPDGVITHILSFLPTTKFAATTSVLSKRWRSLFLYIPNIDVDEDWESNPEDQITRLQILFHDFVDRLLLHPPQDSNLRRARLSFKKHVPDDRLDAWICAAISRRVQELELVAYGRRSDKFPHQIFNSKSLESLGLSGRFNFDAPPIPSPSPGSVHKPLLLLPNLKNVNLSCVQLTDGGCLRRAFSTLQHLKHLSVRNCLIDDKQILEIVCPSLENLIVYWHCKIDSELKIALHTPNLECFECCGSWGFVQVKENLSCLVRADIDFMVSGTTEIGLHGSMIIKDIHNVRDLSFMAVFEESVEALCDSPCPWPTFHNLLLLKLEVNFRVGWKLLNKFLECSPNLQVLHFDQGCIYRHGLIIEYSLPACLSRHLREIKIKDFCGTEFEFELVKYFLRSGQVLEKIKIRPILYWDWPSSQKLLGYPRCSSTCKIIMSWKILKGLYDATELSFWASVKRPKAGIRLRTVKTIY